MKESYKEFKNECLSNKLKIIQSIEDQLIEGKLGSESVLFTDFMYNTHELLGIEPPKNRAYEAIRVNRIEVILDEVISYILQGVLIKDAIRKANQFDTAFYKMLNDKQLGKLQAAKRQYQNG
jgi:hypothetical protein